MLAVEHETTENAGSYDGVSGTETITWQLKRH